MDKKPKGNDIAQAGSTALEKLSIRKRIYVEHRIAGETIKASAAAAGVSRRYGQSLEKKPDVQEAYRDQLRKIMPIRTVANLVKGGAHATMPVYGPDGKKKKDRPDWRTRRAYIQMTREDAGYVEKNKGDGGVTINLNIEQVGNATTRSVTASTTEAESA